MNKTGADKAGHPQLELLGKLLTEVVPDPDAKGLHALFEKALTKGHSVKDVVPVTAPDGLPGAFENTVVPFGKDLVFATYRDVSEVEREHTRLLWLTEHDFLTGMPNRAKLQESLAESVASAREKGRLTGFVFIDIDHFKNVNDTYGHDVGDAVLVNFVKRIRNSLPASALVARIAGDEFAVLLHELEQESQLKELMDEVFAAMQRPFKRDEIDIPITCSAGCVLTDGTAHPDEIMRIADKAMYRAKFEGRNRFLVEPIVQIT
jgi:diguanylate cyclase (GGDEF)-like protein